MTTCGLCSRTLRGVFWIGTADGLDLLDRAFRGRFSHHRPRRRRCGITARLVSSCPSTPMPRGLMWIGHARAAGVSRWESSQLGTGAAIGPEWLRKQAGHPPFLPTGLANKVWVGTLGDGFISCSIRITGAGGGRWDTLTGHSNSVGDSRVMSLLLQDRRGNLWIGTMANGVKKLGYGWPVAVDTGRGLGDPRKPERGRHHDNSRDAPPDNCGSVHMGGGVNILDPSTGLVRQLPVGRRGGSALPASVRFARGSKPATCWVGHRRGEGSIWWRRRWNGCEGVFGMTLANPATLSANTVYCASRSTLRIEFWVGTDGGRPRPRGWCSQPRRTRFRFQTMSREQGPLERPRSMESWPTPATSGSAGRRA